MRIVPFGQTLFLWRLERGLTQAALARRARIPRPNLSAIERGKREVTLRTLRALAVSLNIRPGLLVDGVPPGAAQVKSEHLSRKVLDRVVSAVAYGTPVRDGEEQTLVDVLRKLVKHRALASKKRWQRPRQGKRVTAVAWLWLTSRYSQEEIQHLVQRITDRLR